MAKDRSTGFMTVKIPLNAIPKNGSWVEAYELESEIIILGMPEDGHDCDLMDCGYDHVVYRFNKSDSLGNKAKE